MVGLLQPESNPTKADERAAESPATLRKEEASGVRSFLHSPQVVDDLDHVVLHLDGQEVGVRPQHRGHVVVRPRQGLAVVRNLETSRDGRWKQ